MLRAEGDPGRPGCWRRRAGRVVPPDGWCWCWLRWCGGASEQAAGGTNLKGKKKCGNELTCFFYTDINMIIVMVMIGEIVNTCWHNKFKVKRESWKENTKIKSWV